jgi:hypothetical protein
MSMTRRGFLTRAALAGGALVLPSGLLTTVGGCSGVAERRTDHYFVFYYMVGGWDLMMSTDPMRKKDGFFIPYEDSDIIEVGNQQYGPAMKSLLPYMGKMAILRGIYCDALNHPQARFRMVTGKFKPPGPSVTAPSVQTLIAAKYGGPYQLPNISTDVMRPAVFRGDADPHLEPIRIGTVEQLKALTTLDADVNAYRAEVEEVIAKKNAATTAHYGDGSGLPGLYQTFAGQARDVFDSDFHARALGMNRDLLANTIVGGRNRDQAQLAVEAIKQDLAPCISVGSGEFDTHTGSEYKAHPAAVIRGFETVAAIADGLEDVVLPNGETLLDRTTIVITSEFSRTPSKNELGGKHHWPANSMIFMGKGCAHGKDMPVVFGETDQGLNPIQVNTKTGSKKKGVEDLEMTHGLATLLAIAGVDPGPILHQDPITQLLSTG